MNQKPRISVVMPVHNPPAKRFKHCVASVLGQDHENLELILVDDDSDDSTQALIEEIASTDSRVEFIRIKHMGAGGARNIGTQRARGRYVTYIDCDDAVPEYTLSRMCTIAQNTCAQVTFGLHRVVSCIDDEQPSMGAYHKLQESELRSLLDYVVGGAVAAFRYKGKPYPLRIGPVASLVEVGLAKAISFPTTLFVSEDTIWLIKLLRHAQTVAIADDIWYWRWVNEGSLAHSFQPQIYENAQQFMEELRDVAKPPGRPLKEEYLLARCLGEVNRVAKNYALPEWQEGSYDLSKKPRLLLKEDFARELLTCKNVRKGGPLIAAKLILIKTGLIVPFWRFRSRKG